MSKKDYPFHKIIDTKNIVRNPFIIKINIEHYNSLRSLKHIHTDDANVDAFMLIYGYNIDVENDPDKPLPQNACLDLFAQAAEKYKNSVNKDSLMVQLSCHGDISPYGEAAILCSDGKPIFMEYLLDRFRDPNVVGDQAARQPKMFFVDICKDSGGNIIFDYEAKQFDTQWKNNEILIYGCQRGNHFQMRQDGSIMTKYLCQILKANVPKPFSSLFADVLKKMKADVEGSQVLKIQSKLMTEFYFVPKKINFKHPSSFIIDNVPTAVDINESKTENCTPDIQRKTIKTLSALYCAVGPERFDNYLNNVSELTAAATKQEICETMDYWNKGMKYQTDVFKRNRQNMSGLASSRNDNMSASFNNNKNSSCKLTMQTNRIASTTATSNHIGTFSCRFCGATFTSNVQVQQHERVHTGQKPFECDKCYKQFKSNVELRNHIKTKHGLYSVTSTITLSSLSPSATSITNNNNKGGVL